MARPKTKPARPSRTGKKGFGGTKSASGKTAKTADLDARIAADAAAIEAIEDYRLAARAVARRSLGEQWVPSPESAALKRLRERHFREFLPVVSQRIALEILGLTIGKARHFATKHGINLHTAPVDLQAAIRALYELASSAAPGKPQPSANGAKITTAELEELEKKKIEIQVRAGEAKVRREELQIAEKEGKIFLATDLEEAWAVVSAAHRALSEALHDQFGEEARELHEATMQECVQSLEQFRRSSRVELRDD